MKIFNAGRGSGKTHQCVAWVKESPKDRVIITPTHARARQIRQDYNLCNDNVMAEASWIRLAPTLWPNKTFVYDEAEDLILSAFRNRLGSTPEFFTSTMENITPGDPGTPLEMAERLEARASLIRILNQLPPYTGQKKQAPEDRAVADLVELGEALGKAVKDFLNKKS